LCSYNDAGAKLKSFVPIIKTAASGYTTVAESDRLDSDVVEKKKMRSLKEIDFRNCASLIDTDISILCSLHSTVSRGTPISYIAKRTVCRRVYTLWGEIYGSYLKRVLKE
jgi:hypothetical protein